MNKYKLLDGTIVELAPGAAVPEGAVLVEAASAPAAVPPPAEAKPTTPPAAVAAAVPVDGKTVMLPTSAFVRIKKDEREKGRKEARNDLAKQYNFASAEEMDAHLKSASAARAAKPGAEGAGAGAPAAAGAPPAGQAAPAGMSPAAQAAWEAERKRLSEEGEVLRRNASLAEKRAAKERARANDMEMRMALERKAIKAGVSDIDYALFLLQQHVAGLTDEQVQAMGGQFDEDKFFVELKTTRPYLFGEAPPKPANTGPANASPPAPAPAAVAGANGANGRVDARKMNRQEYAEHLRKRGLNPGSV